jgi:transcriptional regulator with XRE-family HTH domain
VDGRTVQPAGDKIRKLRMDRGLSVERLAQAAALAEKSIVNAEKGRNVLLSTINQLAKAFKVDVKELLQSNAEPVQEQEQTIRIEIVLKGSLLEFLKQPGIRSIVESLFKLLVANDAIKIDGLRSGSIIITLEMSQANALRLVVIFPHFQEYAWESIRSTPEGQAYFSGTITDEEQIFYVQRLLSIANAVQELRIPTGEEDFENDGDDAVPTIPPPEDAAPEPAPADATEVKEEPKPEEPTLDLEEWLKNRVYIGSELDILGYQAAVFSRYKWHSPGKFVSLTDPSIIKTFDEALDEVDPEGKWEEFCRTHKYIYPGEAEGTSHRFGWYKKDEG